MFCYCKVLFGPLLSVKAYHVSESRKQVRCDECHLVSLRRAMPACPDFSIAAPNSPVNADNPWGSRAGRAPPLFNRPARVPPSRAAFSCLDALDP